MFNQVKIYAELLDFIGMSNSEVQTSLRRVFNRDIQDNNNFSFEGKVIRPLKVEGQASMDTVYGHLTTHRIEVEEDGVKFKRSIYDQHRSVRLHWLRFHIDRGAHQEVEIFSVRERDPDLRKDMINTYVYNASQRYVIVLQLQDSELDYYLLTAYYLNEKWGPKSIEKKIKQKLEKVY